MGLVKSVTINIHVFHSSKNRPCYDRSLWSGSATRSLSVLTSLGEYWCVVICILFNKFLHSMFFFYSQVFRHAHGSTGLELDLWAKPTTLLTKLLL